MRIGTKLTLALVLPMVTLTLVLGWLFEVRSRKLLREELGKEGRAISRVVQIASEDYLRDRQLADLQELANRISGYERVLGLRLFDQEGRLTYQPASLDPYPFQHWAELRQALADGRTVEMRRLIDREPAVGFIVPLFNGSGNLVGAVQVLQLESYIEQDDRETRLFILVLTLAMVVAILVIVPLVTRLSIGRPVAALVESFREVGAREVPSSVPVRGRDEFAWLTREFNGMCERLESTRERLSREQAHRREVQSELRNAERLAGLGRLAAGLAHEIGTPLNVILWRAEALRRDAVGGEASARPLGIIVTQGERIARIVRDMLDFARMRPRRHVPTDLGATLRSVAELLERRCEEQAVAVEMDVPPGLPAVAADPDQMLQVVLNLASNALDAMPEGGRLRLAASATSAGNRERGTPPEPCVAVVVHDSGTGIDPEAITHVFDPFYTTKDAGRGTGLGLSVAYGIVEEHAGWFEVRSDPAGGTSFTVLLPLREPEAAEGDGA